MFRWNGRFRDATSYLYLCTFCTGEVLGRDDPDRQSPGEHPDAHSLLGGQLGQQRGHPLTADP